MIAWLKKWWAWLAGGLVAIGGLVVAILTLGRVRPKPRPVPKRPETPDVEIPEAPDLDTKPADDYETEKVTEVDDVAESINDRYR